MQIRLLLTAASVLLATAVVPGPAVAAGRPGAVVHAAKTWKLFRTYRGVGSWQSPAVTPAKDYKATVTYACTGSSGGFMYLFWQAKPYSFEAATSPKARGAVTLRGHAGGTKGNFRVSTWVDCSWTVKVYQ
ncbi:hypothetical protein [Actinoplanes awajinensis]|uniref:Uncharacterized protein n=1 Tax=Actinoplanes awajinensis subsp. mycoplanecinus TaxID=135947 RepID=A0A0X3UYF4_9ACTN|nr:hypothetical protein [Actinoplanes awajinensis]KUL37518.1 hypothetical protein ADL15_11740 [Actinoplanes awajinensis subsp. mycoplanecinus]